jgi:uncharacterized protein (DUF58 family)
MVPLKNKVTGKPVYRHGEPVWRVRFIDQTDGGQKEREVTGTAAEETLLAKYKVHKSTKTRARFVPVRLTFDGLTEAFLDDRRTTLTGEVRPWSTWHKTYANWLHRRGDPIAA